MRSYTKYIRVMVTRDEKIKIRNRMKSCGMQNMSAYLRRMGMEGYILKLDLSDINEVARLLRINSNNLNQYAKKANETGSIYKNDIDELKKQQRELWELLKNIYQRLSSI